MVIITQPVSHRRTSHHGEKLFQRSHGRLVVGCHSHPGLANTRYSSHPGLANTRYSSHHGLVQENTENQYIQSMR